MILIAVDPHKSSHTAVALDQRGAVLARTRVPAHAQGRMRLRAWAARWPQADRRWAVEGAFGLGRGLAQWLVSLGEEVIDVPAKLSARVRLLAVGGTHKNDPADADAVGQAALRHPGLPRVLPDDQRTVLRLLSERRDDLTRDRTRAVNRLHVLLRDLIAGGAPAKLSADTAAGLLARIRPSDPAGRGRKALARDLLAQVRWLDRALARNADQIQAAVDATGTGLVELFGVAAITAAKVLGHTGDVRRFPTRHHYASYNGSAPVEASSGTVVRHRLNRGGNRQLNSALHTIAITQIRHDTPGRAYYQRKLTEGKSEREALRALKRQLSDAIYRRLSAESQQRHPTAA